MSYCTKHWFFVAVCVCAGAVEASDSAEGRIQRMLRAASSREGGPAPAEVMERIRSVAASNAIPDETIYTFAKAIVREAALASQTNSAERAGYEAWRAARLLGVMSASQNRSLLPFFEEISLSSVPTGVRECAAQAYVKIATAGECTGFLPKILALNDDKGHWRYGVTSKLLSKIDAAIASHEISDKALTRLLFALVSYTQSTTFSTEAEWVDNFLVKHCDGYQTSEQRLFLWSGIVKAGNELEKKHFIPIKETIEAVPEKQRTDLRARFPDLPPLPKDKVERSPIAIALAVGAALVAVCAAAWITTKRRRARNHADGQPNPR